MIDALVRRARWLLPLLIVALLLPLASPWLHGRGGRIAWLLDLAVHWQGLYALILLPVVLLCGWRDRRFLPVGLLVLLPWWTAGSRLPPTTETSRHASFQVISANVHLRTMSPERLIAWTRESPADVLVLIEVSPAYARALAGWPDYPHRVVEPGDDPFGIAVLSRHPFASQAILRDARGIASIDVDLDTPNGCVALRAMHPMPPISPEDKVTRDRFLAASVDALAARGRPALVAGDFNATPWSSGFVRVMAAGWQRATGLAPTWPTRGQGVVGIAIDHIVASPHWRRVDSARGPDLGSDHYPVRAMLARAPSARCPGARWSTGARIASASRVHPARMRGTVNLQPPIDGAIR